MRWCTESSRTLRARIAIWAFWAVCSFAPFSSLTISTCYWCHNRVPLNIERILIFLHNNFSTPTELPVRIYGKYYLYYSRSFRPIIPRGSWSIVSSRCDSVSCVFVASWSVPQSHACRATRTSSAAFRWEKGGGESFAQSDHRFRSDKFTSLVVIPHFYDLPCSIIRAAFL